MESLITLFADFNNADKEGRIRLNTTGALNDLKMKNIRLKPGLQVILDDNDELRITGVVEFSDKEGIWVARIDWDNLK